MDENKRTEARFSLPVVVYFKNGKVDLTDPRTVYREFTVPEFAAAIEELERRNGGFQKHEKVARI